MSSNGEAVELQRLRESARRARVFYEIFPVLTYQSSDAAIDWFEVALHAEADAYNPLDGPEGRESTVVLKELAELLARHLPAEGSCDQSLSAWYYTAQPPAAGKPLSATRLFRSLSLMVFNMPPYRRIEQPPLLAKLIKQLEKLDIARIEIAH